MGKRKIHGWLFKLLLQKVWIFLLLIMVGRPALAQQPGLTRPLSIGDTLPAFQLSATKKYGDYFSNKENFKRKLVIIDFWATWCGSCVASFPKLEKLQKRMGEKLSILLVTEEHDTTVKKFEERRRRAGLPGLSIPNISIDTLLSKLFPHSYLPHIVWVDKRGVVSAITETAELTEENVQAMLDGRTTGMQTKNDRATDDSYDPQLPFFLNGNGGDGRGVTWYSVLSKQVPQLQGAMALMRNDADGGFIQVSNAGINSLLLFAYSDNEHQFEDLLATQRIEFSVRDSLRWFPAFSGTKLVKGELYNYSLKTPMLPDKSVKHCMQQDLQRFFNFDAVWQKRRMDVLVLTVNDTGILKHAYTDTLSSAHASSPYHYNSLGNPLRYFVQYLNNSCRLPYLVVNETGYEGLALFSLEADMSNWQSIAGAMKSYKMQLRREKRWISVLRVKER